jgi:hypothetical protein
VDVRLPAHPLTCKRSATSTLRIAAAEGGVERGECGVLIVVTNRMLCTANAAFSLLTVAVFRCVRKISYVISVRPP